MLNIIIGSLQSKVLMGVSLLSLLVSQIFNFSFATLVGQLILAVALSYNANCLVNGNCGIWSWFTVAIPILVSVLNMVASVKSSNDDDDV